jgi:hypothetical protein
MIERAPAQPDQHERQDQERDALMLLAQPADGPGLIWVGKRLRPRSSE